MLACRVPSGLVILTVCGVDGRPRAGRTISDAMRRWPCQLRWMTGLALSAVHGMLADPLIRLAGNPAGSAPGVAGHADLQQARAGRADRGRAARPARGRAGRARKPAAAGSPGRRTVNVRAIGAVAAGSARANGDGTCWWKEKTADAACLPAGSWAGWSRRVTRTPGISTSEMPAPGYPRSTRRAAAIVMRSQLVRPGTTFSGWIAPVAATVGGDAAGRGGHPEQAGDLPGRAVVEQAYPDAGRQVQRAGEADLDPLLHRRPLVALGPRRRRVAVEGAGRVVLLGVGDPGAVGRRGHAGRAGQYGLGQVPGGRHRQQLPGRAARPAELAGVGRVRLGRGVGVGDVGVDQAEQRVGAALPVGDRPPRGPGRRGAAGPRR